MHPCISIRGCVSPPSVCKSVCNTFIRISKNHNFHWKSLLVPVYCPTTRGRRIVVPLGTCFFSNELIKGSKNQLKNKDKLEMVDNGSWSFAGTDFYALYTACWKCAPVFKTKRISYPSFMAFPIYAYAVRTHSPSQSQSDCSLRLCKTARRASQFCHFFMHPCISKRQVFIHPSIYQSTVMLL